MLVAFVFVAFDDDDDDDLNEREEKTDEAFLLNELLKLFDFGDDGNGEPLLFSLIPIRVECVVLAVADFCSTQVAINCCDSESVYNDIVIYLSIYIIVC